MRKVVGVFVILTVVVVPRAHSQAGFPTNFTNNIDGISAFYRMSRLNGASGWRPEPTGPCPPAATGLPLCGWGFELVYDLNGEEQTQTAPPTDSWGDPVSAAPAKKWLGLELAVGYDFLNVHATTRGGDAKYELFGSIQTLPSVTLYFSHDVSDRLGFYAGVGTGFVVLKSARAYALNANGGRTGKVVAITADTWAFAPSLGTFLTIRQEDKDHLGSSLFIEGSYEFRNFTSVSYAAGTDLPQGLQPSLYGSGFTLNVGVELKFRKKPPQKETKNQ